MNKSLVLNILKIDALDKKYQVFDEYFTKFYHFVLIKH